MQLSVELTLSPLQDNFEPTIKDFIKNLRASGFTVKETPLSTQIYGEYQSLMNFLTTAIQEAVENEKAVVLQMKLFKGDRSSYVPSF